MSAELPNDGGAAFPLGTVDGYCTDGMSLRDYFAAAALTGFMANPDLRKGKYDNTWSAELCAQRAFSLADAMLKARALASRDDEMGE